MNDRPPHQRRGGSGPASVAGDLRVRLLGVEAEITRLQMLVDELSCERSDLIALAADLLKENDRLRTRH